jgi:hypothetical protein
MIKTSKLVSIYTKLKKLGLIKKDEIIDISQLAKDLDYLNKLLYDTYLIFNSKLSDEEKINKIYNLRDPDNKRLFSREVAKKILERYQDKVVFIINNIKKKRIENIHNIQKGGAPIDVSNNKIDKILNSKKYKDLIYKFQNNHNILNLQKQIQMVIATQRKCMPIDRFIDWVFFPLYNLENLPMVGFMFEIPLDMISIILDNTDVIMEGIAPIVPLALDLATDVGSGVPVPGLNTAIAAMSVGLSIMEEPMEWLLADGIDVIGLYLNIQRKQWGLAYLSALEVFPQLPGLIDAAVTNMYTANKYLGKIKDITQMAKDNSKLMISLKDELVRSPTSAFKPLKIWENVIYPNRNKVKLLQKAPIEKINNYIPMFKSLLNKQIGTDELMKNILDKKNIVKNYKLY